MHVYHAPGSHYTFKHRDNSRPASGPMAVNTPLRVMCPFLCQSIQKTCAPIIRRCQKSRRCLNRIATYAKGKAPASTSYQAILRCPNPGKNNLNRRAKLFFFFCRSDLFLPNTGLNVTPNFFFLSLLIRLPFKKGRGLISFLLLFFPNFFTFSS